MAKVCGWLMTMLTAIMIASAVTPAVNAQVMSGDKYSITSSVVGSGGGSSANSDKRIDGTAGQSAAGGPLANSSFSHTAGFWAAASATPNASPTPNPSPTPPPTFSLSISDVSQAEGNSGTTIFTFIVTLSNANSQTVTVNYTTVNGTADGSDYQFANGLITFNPGELSESINISVNGDTQVEANETFYVNLSNAVNATIVRAQGTGTILNDDAPSQATAVQFAQTTYNVQEDLGVMTVTVVRTGDTSGASSVDYKTVDGTATQKADFEYAAGTLNFAPGETGKTFQILLNEDMYIEGTEIFSLVLTNPAGATLGVQSTSVVNINDDSPESATNPIDDPGAFVYTHYHDFLNREPDSAGLQFWTNQITQCGADTACLSTARTNVSAAFYLSIEFQQTGYLLYLMQKASYGSMPKYTSFMRDLQEVSRGVVVLAPAWQQKLADNQQQFANEWVSRPEFKSLYDGMSNMVFINSLYANAGVVPKPADRDALVTRLDNASESRAAAILEVGSNSAFRQQEMNSAFVLMEYFGYLRRDPNASPDKDMSGYIFWLNKLNQFSGNFQDAEMVKAFIISLEYRQRFGQ
jgi:hypothetical protein